MNRGPAMAKADLRQQTGLHFATQTDWEAMTESVEKKSLLVAPLGGAA